MAHPTYRRDIDGIRSIAIIPVLLYHLGVPGVGGGYVGVDIFFVISGYLITSIIYEDISSNSFSIWNFYERRIRRIFPALFFVIAICAVSANFLLIPTDLVAFSDSAVRAMFFVSNVYFFNHSNYFDGSAQTHPLLHTWSLAVEEQFYIIFPILLWSLHRLSQRYVVLFLSILCGGSLAISIWCMTYEPVAAFYLLPSRAWELLIGALLALKVFPDLPTSWIRNLLAFAGISLIGWAIFTFTTTTAFPGLNALFPCLGTALLILAGSRGSSVVGTVLSTSPLVFIGQISYSLYLVHWPLIVFTTMYLARPLSAGEQIVLCAIALALATASWRFVERPFRRSYFPNRRWAVFAAAAIVMASSAQYAERVTKTHGFPKRFPIGIADVDMSGRALYGDPACFLEDGHGPSEWRGQDCLFNGNRPEKVLLWGDSFAAHYMPGIRKSPVTIPFAILEYTKSGCPPIFGFSAGTEGPNCRKFNDNVHEIVTRYRTDTVILAADWQYEMREGERPADLTATVRILKSWGLKIIVIGQSPVLAVRGGPAYAWHLFRPNAHPGSAPVVFPLTLNPTLKAAAGAVTFFNPMEPFCAGGQCRLGEGRKAYYWDEGHFTTAGSLLALSRLLVPISCVIAHPVGTQDCN